MVPSPSPLTELLRRDPVVITGTGAVSACGTGSASLWQAVVEKKSPARMVELPIPGGGTMRTAGYPVETLDWRDHRWSGMARRLDRGAQYALLAAHEAAEQALLLVRSLLKK